MRIRVWNAFASNNSGSYTIVGSFADAARATEVARELDEVIAAHSEWHKDHHWEPSDESPMVAFARARGLDAPATLGSGDAWPNYGDPPSVIAIDHQVVVHAPYTVTLPRTFGELFYARGGEVETCLNHAHHPLVVHVEVYWPYGMDQQEGRVEAVEKAVMDPGSPVWALVAKPTDLVCARGKDWLDAPLVIGAVYEDLIAGVRAVAALAKEYLAGHRVKILEALDVNDPLSHLRAAP